MRRSRHVIATTVAAALAVAACGSDPEESSGAGTAPGSTTTTTIAPAEATADESDTATDPAAADTTTSEVTSTTAVTVTDTDTGTGTGTGTSDVAASGPAPGCTRVDDFDADLATWFIVNDGVMGGRSDGRFEVADSLLTFAGTVVTDGGGFTSVRLRLDGDELTGSDRVVLRLQADARVYGLTYEDDEAIQGRRVAHVAALTTDRPVDDDGFQVVELPHAALRPSIFGRAVDTPAFDPAAAREIGIIIADGVDGPFRLVVDWIDACA